MKILIVGAGNLGLMLAKNLSSDKKDVIIIDKNQETCSEIVDQVNAKVICADATKEEALLESGIKNIDFFITVTGSDETNLLCSLLAKEYSNCKLATRVSNETYKKIFEQAGINIIVSPEAAGAEALELMVIEPDVLTMASEHRGGVMLLQKTIEEHTKLAGKSVLELETKDFFRFVSVKRDDQFLIPNKETTLKVDDSVIMIVKKGSEEKIRKMFR